MTQSDILNHKVTFPSLEEQYQIADYLDTQTAKIDQAIALKTAYIEKLKEYKSVLINDVVTGKVRVSVWRVRSKNPMGFEYWQRNLGVMNKI